jgi:two-component system response regulator FlrC
MTRGIDILVVEDDSALRDALCLTLECAGYGVTAAAEGAAALRLVGDKPFNLVLSDLKMQPMDGLALLRELRRREPCLPVLLMTAFGDVDKAVAAMRGGACDFLLKPFEPATLLEHVERYAFVAPKADGLIAVDARTRNVLALAARVARTDATVLLTGESGCGKEVFARYIHGLSPRAGGPFIAINCAAIPDNLLEATLFGYEKGAFTGAHSAQPGKFEQADCGTLLLDEVSEMPMSLQAKLLRVLQEREVERVGGRKPVPVDIRVLATSNRDMAQEVARGSFREDLYYRLNVFPLRIPALRERRDDVVPLARHFAALHGQRIGVTGKLGASAEAALAAQRWSGNVRELENVVQRALILAGGDAVEAEHLYLPEQDAACDGSLPGPVEPVANPTAPPAEQLHQAAPAAPASMKDLERQHILDTLAAVGGSRKKAVERLGISERTLRYKLQQYRTTGMV